jgi:UDP-N-acetylmuramate dehydrogenase
MPITRETANWLRRIGHCRVTFNAPMSRHTTYRVGGMAAVLLEPETPQALTGLINGFYNRNIPFHILGGGSNVLVPDEGLSYPVIRLTRCLKQIAVLAKTPESITIAAGAGAMLHALCRFCIQNGYDGFNFAVGIPGTVGGAIRGNAGTASGWISNVLDAVVLMTRSGKTVSIKKGQWQASYRRISFDLNGLAENGYPVILSGIFSLKPGKHGILAEESDRLKQVRRSSQPVCFPNAGCVFRNPDPKHPAGMLIDQAGLKGLTIGGAKISEKHANFIINTGNATATDILSLIDRIRHQVQNCFGITLETELIVLDEQRMP